MPENAPIQEPPKDETSQAADAGYPPIAAVPPIEEPTDQIATFESEGGAALPAAEPTAESTPESTPEPAAPAPVVVTGSTTAPPPEAAPAPPTLTAVPPLEDPIATFEGEGGAPLPPAENQ